MYIQVGSSINLWYFMSIVVWKLSHSPINMMMMMMMMLPASEVHGPLSLLLLLFCRFTVNRSQRPPHYIKYNRLWRFYYIIHVRLSWNMLLMESSSQYKAHKFILHYYITRNCNTIIRWTTIIILSSKLFRYRIL